MYPALPTPAPGAPQPQWLQCQSPAEGRGVRGPPGRQGHAARPRHSPIIRALWRWRERSLRQAEPSKRCHVAFSIIRSISPDKQKEEEGSQCPTAIPRHSKTASRSIPSTGRRGRAARHPRQCRHAASTGRDTASSLTVTRTGPGHQHSPRGSRCWTPVMGWGVAEGSGTAAEGIAALAPSVFPSLPTPSPCQASCAVSVPTNLCPVRVHTEHGFRQQGTSAERELQLRPGACGEAGAGAPTGRSLSSAAADHNRHFQRGTAGVWGYKPRDSPALRAQRPAVRLRAAPRSRRT